jgi:zinc/manganese transport system ATP-binding protein
VSAVLIELDNLTVSYDRHPAVHHVSGSLREGSLTAIAGPNGAG